jgi:hypothetical protein
MGEKSAGDQVLQEMGVHKSGHQRVCPGERSAKRPYYGKADRDKGLKKRDKYA